MALASSSWSPGSVLGCGLSFLVPSRIFRMPRSQRPFAVSPRRQLCLGAIRRQALTETEFSKWASAGYCRAGYAYQLDLALKPAGLDATYRGVETECRARNSASHCAASHRSRSSVSSYSAPTMNELGTEEGYGQYTQRASKQEKSHNLMWLLTIPVSVLMLIAYASRSTWTVFCCNCFNKNTEIGTKPKDTEIGTLPKWGY